MNVTIRGKPAPQWIFWAAMVAWVLGFCGSVSIGLDRDWVAFALGVFAAWLLRSLKINDRPML